jgi:hypothetical protein
MIADRLKDYASRKKTVFVNTDGGVHDRSTTVGASESYACLRKVWFDKNQPVESDGWGFFARGHLCEEWLVDHIRKSIPDDWQLLYAGDDQVTLKNGRLSSTSDGLLVTPDEDIAVELKSLDPRSNFDKPKPQHVQQMHVQMGMYREKTGHRPERGLLIYLDASDFSHIVEHWIEYDPAVYANAKRRADQVFTAPHAASLPAEGALANECRYCSHTEPCGQAVVQSYPTGDDAVPEDGVQTLDELVHERAGLVAEMDDLKTEKGVLEERIKVLLRQYNARAVKGDDWSVSYALIAPRKSLDTKALEAAGVDLEPFYKEGKPSERLTIKVRGSE